MLKCTIAKSGILLVLLLYMVSCKERHSEYLYQEFRSACELSQNGNKDEALSRFLDLEQSLKEDDPDTIRAKVFARIGALYYDDYKREQAIPYLKNAVDVARRCGDEYLCMALWNLALVTYDIDSSIPILKECESAAMNSGNVFIQTRAQTALIKLYSLMGNYDEAKAIIENIDSIPEQREIIHGEFVFAKIQYLFSQNRYEDVEKLLSESDTDRLSLDGRNAKYWYLYNIEKNKGNYLMALQFRDSLDNINEEIDSIAHSDKLIEAERQFTNRINTEQRKRNTVMLVGSFVVIILCGCLLWELNRRKLMRKQLELTDKISQLNLRLSQLNENYNDSIDEAVKEIIEKLKLNRELYNTLPESALLRQLNLLNGTDRIDKTKAKKVLDSVICRFADVCNNIRQFCPSMTAEDSLYCAASFAGFSKEVASIAFETSGDALRRRKSRIKQKLPPDLFNAIFGTKS